jgi:hypothetical protein
MFFKTMQQCNCFFIFTKNRVMAPTPVVHNHKLEMNPPPKPPKPEAIPKESSIDNISNADEEIENYIVLKMWLKSLQSTQKMKA